MTAPAFVPPVDRPGAAAEPIEQPQPQQQAPGLSPPLLAMVASIEAARAGMNAQFDALLAQVNALAYVGAAINNARRARGPAAPSNEMPATFGARRESAAPVQRSTEELTDGIESDHQRR